MTTATLYTTVELDKFDAGSIATVSRADDAYPGWEFRKLAGGEWMGSDPKGKGGTGPISSAQLSMHAITGVRPGERKQGAPGARA